MVDLPHPQVALDPIIYQVICCRLSGIVQEMQQVIHRTGFSTIIRESYDTSCAILTPEGRVAGQHVILPLHMGAFPACIQGILRHYPPEAIREGDAFILNHPYEGGSAHAMDMAVVTPMFYRGEFLGFCANMAHKSDIGGMVPGSASGSSTEIFQEGLHVPPIKFMNRFKVVPEVEAVLRANSRTPDLILGDIHGQVGTNRIGERRLAALLDKYGRETYLAVLRELFQRTERRVRGILGRWADGEAEAEGFIDTDGIDLGRPVGIRVRVEKRGARLRFDFRRSDDQTRGPANIRRPLVRSCCHYAFLAVSDPEIPNNEGLAGALEIETREGSILDPRFPAPLTCYAATAQIVMEICIAALCRLSGRPGIAESGGGFSFTLGGRRGDGGAPYVHYEILGSATGARARKDGVSGITVHLANCKIAPIEILETEFPVRLHRFEFVPDSGGAGACRGGQGFRREYEILGDEARLSLRGDKFVLRARGRAGGEPGRSGSCRVLRRDGAVESLPSKVGDLSLRGGDRLLIERAGGGGYGPAAERPAAKVREDVLEGAVSLGAAQDLYRVVLDPETLQIDEEATRSLRSSASGSRGVEAAAPGPYHKALPRPPQEKGNPMAPGERKSVAPVTARSRERGPFAFLAEDVRRGLTARPKELPAKYFYDARGSRLFEEICDLPEYYPTRTEQALLEKSAGGLIASCRPPTLVEFGSGSSRKTRILLDAMEGQGLLGLYIPIDVSGEMIRETSSALGERYPGLQVKGVIGDFNFPVVLPPGGDPRLLAFLGSTIGNMERDESVAFLRRVADLMSPGDRFLLGTDLVKDVSVLEKAYNDSRGVTAAFNRNVLAVINERLGANFRPDRFDHRAFFNREESRIEMHLAAREAHRVWIEEIGLAVDFARGESIRTEISCKYTRESVGAMLEAAGLRLVRWETDERNWFGLSLSARE